MSRAAVSALTGDTYQTDVACRAGFHAETKTGPSFAVKTTMAVCTGQNPNSASQCQSTCKPAGEELVVKVSGQGRNVNTDALSMAALYFIPVCASLKGAERFALITENLGSTNITHS